MEVKQNTKKENGEIRKPKLHLLLTLFYLCLFVSLNKETFIKDNTKNNKSPSAQLLVLYCATLILTFCLKRCIIVMFSVKSELRAGFFWWKLF